MPRKKKVEEPEVENEKVEGRVESLEYGEAEQRVRAEAREKSRAMREQKVYGTTRLSMLTGTILKNRATNSGIREREYSCGAELAGVIDDYFASIFEEQEAGSDILPDVEAMADFLGITRDTIIRWMRGEDNREFVAPLNIAVNEIAMYKKQRAMVDKVNGLVYLSDMQNNHKYLSNQKSADVQLNVTMKHELPSLEQLNQQMKLLDSK